MRHESDLDPVLAGLFDGFDSADATWDLTQLRPGLDRFAAAVSHRRPCRVVTDDVVAGVPVRRYRHQPPSDQPPDHQQGQPGLQLVWAHGGGWIAGSLAAIDPVCRALAVLSGAEVVSVGYRLAPENPFPAGLDDVRAVVAALLASSDLDKVAVGGDSAGAGLAAVVAQEQPALVAQVLLNPMLDATLSSASVQALATGYGLTRTGLARFIELYAGDPVDPKVSPLLAPALTGLPPLVVVTAGLDPLHDDGVAYAQRCRKAGVPVAHRCWESMVHGFVGMSAITPAADEALGWTVASLEQLRRRAA